MSELNDFKKKLLSLILGIGITSNLPGEIKFL